MRYGLSPAREKGITGRMCLNPEKAGQANLTHLPPVISPKLHFQRGANVLVFCEF